MPPTDSFPTWHFIVRWLVTFALAIGMIGCGAAAERLTESTVERALGAASGEDVQLDLGEGGLSIETAEGAMAFGATQEIPDAIAAVVPIPAGFEPAGTFSQRDGDTEGVSVQGALETSDPQATMDQMVATLESDGWSVEGTMSMDQSLITSSLARDGDVLNLSIVHEGGEAMLTVMLIQGAGQ